jgi:RNA polymerase sigma-70 factor (ECF subfamily)
MTVLMGTASDESSILAAAANGDEAAFTALVSAHHDDIRRICVVVAGDEGLADEAVEAAWSIAWLKLRTVRDAARLRAWLASVAVNEARQLLRSRRRRAVVELRVESVPEPIGGQDPAATVAQLDLRAALGRMDPDDRALLAMRYVAGFDSTEIGYATGRSASGTRARLARLLDRLEKELGDA